MKKITLIALLFLFGCGEDPTSIQAVDNNAASLKIEYELDENTVNIQDSPVLGFERNCSSSKTCDQESALVTTYVVHKYIDENVTLYASFDPQVLSDYSLDNISEQFNYLTFTLKFPALSDEKTSVYFTHQEVVRELDVMTYPDDTNGMTVSFTGYANGYLEGVVEGTISRLTYYTEDRYDPTCFVDDILGICYESKDVYIPFSVAFKLSLPADEFTLEEPNGVDVYNHLIQIKPYRSECFPGEVSDSLCLFAKSQSESSFGNFYDPIEGFEFQWGHTYELDVEVTELIEAPADASSLQYKLINIVSDVEDAIGTEYTYELSGNFDYRLSEDDGIYTFVGLPFECGADVDCDLLISTYLGVGEVTKLTFEYIGEGKISLVDWQ